MSKYNANTKVTFSVSTGYVGCLKTETFTLGELGYNEFLRGGNIHLVNNDKVQEIV